MAEYSAPGSIDEPELRAFFHLKVSGETPDQWLHLELYPSDGSPAPIEFELYWVPLPHGVPLLAGELDSKLPQLIASQGS